MVLRGRLKLIYDMIPPCDILADIGTDHALIPAYALLNKRCKKAIACDVREGPLERAKRTLDYFELQEHMDLRLGSGLTPLSQEEADCIVLAGMGGILITELFNEALAIAQQANHIILQPMVGQELVRPYLWRHGFEVLDEGLVREDEKLYQALMVRYTGVIRENWDSLYEVIGEHLLRKGEALLKDWIEDRLEKQQKKVKGLEAARIPSQNLQAEKALMEKIQGLIY